MDTPAIVKVLIMAGMLDFPLAKSTIDKVKHQTRMKKVKMNLYTHTSGEPTSCEETSKDPALAVPHSLLGLPELVENGRAPTPASGVSTISVVFIVG